MIPAAMSMRRQFPRTPPLGVLVVLGPERPTETAHECERRRAP
jgi:hypothetical protein